jgi:undecaprenyl pyrophosphate synthase
VEALTAYQTEREAWEREKAQLEEIMETVKLKLQIGSAKSLEKLIEQADNLADLNIVNTNLLLTTATDETKRLKA